MNSIINSSFSLKVPRLQLAWDSVSLNALKRCPTYYNLTIRQGFQHRTENIHLEFGLALHKASERYAHYRAAGQDHEAAVANVVYWALKDTWDGSLGRPRAVFCDDSNKNRLTLLRTIVWYFDQYADDPCETVLLANGKPAVELSFRMDLQRRSVTTGEDFVLCGHIDRLANYSGTTYVLDIKTTKSTISQDYFAKFSPHGQFSGYALAAKIEFGLPVRGVIVDAAQIAVNFTRFARAPIPRDEATLQEWYEDTLDWISKAESWATQGRWPHNDTACDMYGGCELRGICAKSPLSRGEWLERGFAHRVWDPLQSRGDI